MDKDEPETGLSFEALSPLFARVLDPTTKKSTDYTDAVEESA